MPVVQTVALDRDRKFVQLALLTPAEKKKLQEAMDRQLKLVAHAIVRGQDLPVLGDTSFSMSPPHLEVLRLTNIVNSMVLPSEKTETELRADVQLSRFESTFSSLDFSRLVLKHVRILDMRSLAAVSRTCREIVGSGRVCQLSFSSYNSERSADILPENMEPRDKDLWPLRYAI